jgi:hypothetical protein
MKCLQMAPAPEGTATTGCHTRDRIDNPHESGDGAVLERMRAALDEVATLRRFDVVDLSTAPPALRDRALQEGVSLA